MSIFGRFGAGLAKLRQNLSRTRQLFRSLLTADGTEEMEEALLAADVGVRATELLISRVRRAGADRRQVLEEEIARIVGQTREMASGSPMVVMVVGVNGSGKTTTVGKLCHHLTGQGNRVVVAAADTYRDAAAEQLRVWAGRAGVEMVFSQQGQDAAAVAFDAIVKAQKTGMDVVIVDTAGRLHTRKDLMAEAAKIKRVCGKARPGAPDEVWLVLDATVGQNGIRQAQAFNEQLGLTGLIITKLDGTAKGGVLIPIALELGLPIRFVGTGEGLADIETFAPQEFARALFED